MAKTINESLVEYKGKLEGLVIKVNGVIVYANKARKSTKSPALQKDHEDLKMASVFASCINHVPELSDIWRQFKWKKRRTMGNNKIEVKLKSKFGRPKAFNKIVSANRKEISLKGRPNILNVILPESKSFPYYYNAEFKKDCVDIELLISDGTEKYILDNSRIVPVGIFCFFDAKKTSKAKFEMISKYYEIDPFLTKDKYKILFPISTEDLKTIKDYKNCVFYFAITEHAKSLKRVRWFRHNKALEFSMEGFPKKSVKFGTKHKIGVME